MTSADSRTGRNNKMSTDIICDLIRTDKDTPL